MIEFNDFQVLRRNACADFNVKEIIEELDTYEDDYDMQVYFIDEHDNMVAYWNPYTGVGVIRSNSVGSQWSKRYRKFKKLTKRELEIL